jgi:hypothetical protein
MMKFTRALKVDLTEEEFRERSIHLARTLDKVEDLETEKKSVADRYKSRISELLSGLSSYRAAIRDGWEMRDVECDEMMDYENGIVKIVRTDTLEVVDERPITDAERQLYLEGTEKEEPPEDGRDPETTES